MTPEHCRSTFALPIDLRRNVAKLSPVDEEANVTVTALRPDVRALAGHATSEQTSDMTRRDDQLVGASSCPAASPTHVGPATQRLRMIPSRRGFFPSTNPRATRDPGVVGALGLSRPRFTGEDFERLVADYLTADGLTHRDRRSPAPPNERVEVPETRSLLTPHRSAAATAFLGLNQSDFYEKY